MGTEGSKGTKIFSLVGKVKNSGLVEVPMGITLRDIVFKIGGGVPEGKKFKAVQTGGPSGGVLPESLLDLPVDFDELDKAGSMMGSGGMIVMDEDTCMVDTARYYVNFLAHESCGKCVPCREGLRQMLQHSGPHHGRRRQGRRHRVARRAFGIHGSGFPLRARKERAQSGSQHDPVLPRGIRSAHPRETLPRRSLRGADPYEIDQEKCTSACGACARACAVDAIQKVDGHLHDRAGEVHQVRFLFHGMSGQISTPCLSCRLQRCCSQLQFHNQRSRPRHKGRSIWNR